MWGNGERKLAMIRRLQRCASAPHGRSRLARWGSPPSPCLDCDDADLLRLHLTLVLSRRMHSPCDSGQVMTSGPEWAVFVEGSAAHPIGDPAFPGKMIDPKISLGHEPECLDCLDRPRGEPAPLRHHHQRQHVPSHVECVPPNIDGARDRQADHPRRQPRLRVKIGHSLPKAARACALLGAGPHSHGRPAPKDFRPRSHAQAPGGAGDRGHPDHCHHVLPLERRRAAGKGGRGVRLSPEAV